MMKISCIFLVIILLPMLCVAGEGNITLNVIVKGANPGVGQVILYLFDSEKSFLKSPLKTKKIKIDEKGNARFLLKGLIKGAYAINVVYDEDNDGKLDTGFLGIPTEYIGFSNGAKCRLMPPSFRDAKFDISDTREIVIKLGKAKDQD